MCCVGCVSRWRAGCTEDSTYQYTLIINCSFTHTNTQVVGLSVGIAAFSFPVARWLYFRHWRKMTQQELFEQKMLRYV